MVAAVAAVAYVIEGNGASSQKRRNFTNYKCSQKGRLLNQKNGVTLPLHTWD